jgi:hypothetical protein
MCLLNVPCESMRCESLHCESMRCESLHCEKLALRNSTSEGFLETVMQHGSNQSAEGECEDSHQQAV